MHALLDRPLSLKGLAVEVGRPLERRRNGRHVVERPLRPIPELTIQRRLLLLLLLMDSGGCGGGDFDAIEPETLLVVAQVVVSVVVGLDLDVAYFRHSLRRHLVLCSQVPPNTLTPSLFHSGEFVSCFVSSCQRVLFLSLSLDNQTRSEPSTRS